MPLTKQIFMKRNVHVTNRQHNWNENECIMNGNKQLLLVTCVNEYEYLTWLMNEYSTYLLMIQ